MAAVNGYLAIVKKELPRPQPAFDAPLVLDLFAGCGGLALGFEAAGFRTIGFEMKLDPTVTYSKNLSGDCVQTVIKPETPFGHADVVIGGPPCQPFSVGGFQLGKVDVRNGFPAFLAAVEKVHPRLVMFENVRGMMYRNRRYLDQVIGQLQALGYRIQFQLMNTVDFGVPQRRERLVAVGVREGEFFFPAPVRRFNAGDALKDTASEIPVGARMLTTNQDEYIERYERKSACKRPRDLDLSKPSRTVTCRNLAGATGDMMRIRLPDGRRRRLVPREGARLQGFPDWFKFVGSEASQFEQIGNAVPPLFAKAIASRAMANLRGETSSDYLPDSRNRLALIQ